MIQKVKQCCENNEVTYAGPYQVPDHRSNCQEYHSTTHFFIKLWIIVLAVMVLPIITAISREVFAQTPRLNEEAAIGLGATRWEVVRLAVLPYAKSGIVAGVMLGLGRALGETMAVLMVYSSGLHVTANIIGKDNPQTIAANIANNFAEASDDRRAVLIAIGLVLFVFTFAVNYLARWFIGRGERKFAR